MTNYIFHDESAAADNVMNIGSEVRISGDVERSSSGAIENAAAGSDELSARYIFHTTANNDRWDLIAYKYYGNMYNINPLAEANFHIPLTGTLKEGSVLRVPVDENSKNENQNLPIWKRV